MEPEAIRVAGGNVALPDGSAQWRKMADMKARNVLWRGVNPATPDNSIVGYW
jgi:hypothetical protein